MLRLKVETVDGGDSKGEQEGRLRAGRNVVSERATAVTGFESHDKCLKLSNILLM